MRQLSSHRLILRQISENVGKLDAIAGRLKAIQDPQGKSRGCCVSPSISRQNLHTVITNKSDVDHRTNLDKMDVESNAIRPQVTTRDSRITKESQMSRRGIHPLLIGLDRPKRVVAPKHRVQTSGLESGQRKRYLRSLEAEQAEAASTTQS